MPEKDSPNYEGTCPICGALLMLPGVDVVCMEGHYKANQQDFERVWSEFQEKTEGKALKEHGLDNLDDDVNQLFAGLDALNQVEISADEVARLREIAVNKKAS